MDTKVSDFAKQINLPLLKLIDSINSWPQNLDKAPVNFLSGDPTIYGQTQFQMPAKGTFFNIKGMILLNKTLQRRAITDI